MSQTTVIIPTYNRPHLIGRAVKSVLNQTYQNFEIVIIDSSPDRKTEEVVKAFSDKKIRYFHNMEKTGPSAARNQGIKFADPSSQYIAFLDDDDEYLPQFLEKTVDFLDKNKDVKMVTSNMELRARNGKFIRKTHAKSPWWEQGISRGCVIWKDIFIKENFWYDERLEIMEDPDLGLRILRNHKWECLSDVLFIYYVYPLTGETTLCSVPSVKSVDIFYDKNYRVFKDSGRKALGFFYFRNGKIFLRSGEFKKGRENILKAFITYPNLIYLLHYALTFMELLLPGFSQNVSLRILKQKIFRGKI